APSRSPSREAPTDVRTPERAPRLHQRVEEGTLAGVLGGRWVLDARIDPRAVVEDAPGVREDLEAPAAVVLAHPAVADAAEPELGDQRLDQAVVHARSARVGRLEDLLRD